MTTDSQVYSLKRLQKHFITNTDGTESGTFDEIFTTETITRRDYDDEYHISVGMMGCQELLAIYEFIGHDKDAILITFLADYIELPV